MSEHRDHPHKGMSFSRRSSSGKGDRNRVKDSEAYRNNYDRVFGKDKDKKETKGDSDECKKC